MRRGGFGDAARLLFPRGGAFALAEGSNLARLLDGLFSVADEERGRAERVYADYFPQTTRAFSEWERAFRFRFPPAWSEEDKRAALSALVRLRYASSTVDAIGGVMREFAPGCQVVENLPVANAVGLCFAYRSACANRNVVCGNRRAVCNWHIGERDWIPTVLKGGASTPWDIPYEPEWWGLCFFVCREVFRDGNGKMVSIKRLKVHRKWQKFLEFVVLSLKPVRTIAVMFIEYVPDGEPIEYVDDSDGLVHIDG